MSTLAAEGVESTLVLTAIQGDPDTVRAGLQQGRDFIIVFPLDSATLVGWNVVRTDRTEGALTYELRGAGRSALVSVVVTRSDSVSRITGFHWQGTASPLAELNAFRIGGQGIAHYVYLLLAVASVLACVGGAVLAGLSKMRFWWVLFSLVGVGKATINWTTGQQLFSPLSVQLFGAGFMRSGSVGPWFLSWSLPLGAIFVFARWQSRRKAKSVPGAPVAA
jgi:hypothetical protein